MQMLLEMLGTLSTNSIVSSDSYEQTTRIRQGEEAYYQGYNLAKR